MYKMHQIQSKGDLTKIENEIKKNINIPKNMNAVITDPLMPTYLYFKNFNFLVRRQTLSTKPRSLPNTTWNQQLLHLQPINLKAPGSTFEKMKNKISSMASKFQKFDLKELEKKNFKIIKQKKNAKFKSPQIEEEKTDELVKILQKTQQLLQTHEDLKVPNYSPLSKVNSEYKFFGRKKNSTSASTYMTTLHSTKSEQNLKPALLKLSKIDSTYPLSPKIYIADTNTQRKNVNEIKKPKSSRNLKIQQLISSTSIDKKFGKKDLIIDIPMDNDHIQPLFGSSNRNRDSGSVINSTSNKTDYTQRSPNNQSGYPKLDFFSNIRSPNRSQAKKGSIIYMPGRGLRDYKGSFRHDKISTYYSVVGIMKEVLKSEIPIEEKNEKIYAVQDYWTRKNQKMSVPDTMFDPNIYTKNETIQDAIDKIDEKKKDYFQVLDRMLQNQKD